MEAAVEDVQTGDRLDTLRRTPGVLRVDALRPTHIAAPWVRHSFRFDTVTLLFLIQSNNFSFDTE